MFDSVLFGGDLGFMAISFLNTSKYTQADLTPIQIPCAPQLSCIDELFNQRKVVEDCVRNLVYINRNN